MRFSLGTQNETREVLVGTLETETKLVSNLLLAKSFRTPNAIFYFRNLSLAHNYNESIMVADLGDYLHHCFEKVIERGSF